MIFLPLWMYTPAFVGFSTFMPVTVYHGAVSASEATVMSLMPVVKDIVLAAECSGVMVP